MCESYDAASHESVRRCESTGDELTRRLIEQLETSFVTPFDREDIHTLTSKLDDVVDSMHEVSELLHLLPRVSPPVDLTAQCDVLVAAGDVTVDLVGRLDGLSGVRPLLERVHALETQGDEIYRSRLAQLFGGELDALDVLRWKGAVELLEEAIDGVEDVADVIETIALKHA